jgi:peptide/nickel transport system substrate-binding protein
MEIIRKKETNDVHPYVPELKDLYQKGRITRREFLRNAALLGLSLSSASAFLAACAKAEPTPTPVPTATKVPPTPTLRPTDTPRPTSTPVPKEVVKRGGTLRIQNIIYGIDHPARFSWGDAANCVRFVNEYLTHIDPNNVTHPYLCERWEASEDLKTWTLHLRKGVTWNTGEPFNADDVVFTMTQWLDDEVGSSIKGLMSYLQPTNIEKVDDYTVRLHLDSAQIAVPENLTHYPALILDHRTFEGDWLKAPVGTGPFTMEEWAVEERAVFKARDGYWQMGADGKPLPYLDEVIHIQTGGFVAALSDGEIDAGQFMSPSDLEAIQAIPGIAIDAVASTQTAILRMRVDLEPWSDARVRNALKLCQDREKILKVAYMGEGVVGPDCHVSPVHPEFCPMDPSPYDPEQAKALLAEAGYADGLDVTIAVMNDYTYTLAYAETLQQDAKAAGRLPHRAQCDASQHLLGAVDRG